MVFVFLISCMAFRLEDTIPALIRPPSCTIRLSALLLLLFFLSYSRYHHTLGYRLLCRQTILGGWTTSLQHHPAVDGFALFQASFLLVLDYMSSLLSAGPIVAPG
jgi:hypothetical protein